MIEWLTAGPATVQLNISLCGKDSVMFPVIVNALPALPSITAVPSPGCIGQSVVFSTTSPGTWNWNFGDPPSGGLNTATTNPAPHTYNISGDYDVQLYVTNANGCSDTSFTKLHVDSVAPVPVISGPLNVCSSGSSSYSFPSAQQFAGATYTWTLSSTLGTITASTFNTVSIQWAPVIVNTPVTLSLNITSPCLNTSVPVLITVNAPPVPVITPPNPVCQGALLPYSGAPLGAASYVWSFAGTGASGQTVNFAFPNAGTQTVDLTVTDGFGCSAKTSVLVDVKPAPTANIFTADPTVFCNPTPINCTLNALNGPGYTFAWFNPGACGTGPTKTVTNGSCGPGGYYVVVTNTNGCTASSNVITISQITCPVVPGCTPDPYTLNLSKVHVGCTDVNFTTSASGNVSNLSLSYGGGFGGSTPHTYTLPGIYTVVLSGTVPGLDQNGLPCVATVSISDTVIIPLIAKFNFEYDCTSGNIQVKLKDQSLFLTGHNITTWNWYTEPGHVFLVSGQNPPLQTIVSGTQISLDIVSSTGFVCSVTNTVTIPAPIIAGFTTSTPICVGSPVTFFDNSTLAPPNVLISRLWSFGNAGATSANASPQYTYPGTGPYNLVYTVTDLYGCIRTATTAINPVNPVTGPITGPLTGCGSVTLTAPCNSGYLWSTTATTSSITVTTNGSYAVIAYSCDGNGCPFTSAAVNVTINPIPTAVITGKTIYCPGENLDLKTPATAGYSYSWQQIPGGPVGTNSPVLNIPVPSAGVYNYQVTVTLNGCTATSAMYSITVDTVPGSAVIDSSGSLTFCDGDSVMLFTNPVGFGYQWTTSPPPQPSPNNTPSIYAKVSGTYGVFVTTANGCPFPPIAPVIVTVNPLPPVNIMGSLVYCEHDTLKLQTSPGYNYVWTHPAGTYNGGNILTINNVSPANSGQYIVTVTDPITGCTNADTVMVIVNPVPATPIITANAPLPLCVGQLFIFSVSNVFPSPISYLWNTGQVGTQVPAAIAGSYNVSAINSITGCKATSNTLTINPTPDLSCVPTGCYDLCSECIASGDTIVIPGPAGFASYNWQVLNGLVWQNYPPAGSQDLLLTDTLCHDFRLIAYSAAGCSDTSGVLNVCFHACCDSVPVDTCYERCVYFNDIPNDLHGFGPYIPTAPNVNVAISNVGSQNGQFDKYVRAVDLTGPSGVAAGPIFNGMWCCGYLCFDYIIFDDGLAGSSPNIHPKFVIKNAAGKGFMFTVAGTLNENSGWESFHAPTCLDSIPYDPADGIWTPITGTSVSDWSSVAGHIASLAFLTDYVVDSGAQTGLDNICFIPGSLGLECFAIPVHCGAPNSGVGFVFVTDTIGCPNFTYYWSTGAVTTTNSLPGLPAGNYCVTVVNCCGCADSCCFTVLSEDTLVIHIDSITPVHCPGTSNGGIIVHASGGTPPYTYLWSNNATTQGINNLPAGTYTVTVSCATGCSISQTIVVPAAPGCICTPPPPLPTITINSTVPDNCNSTGCIHASFTGCCPLLFSYTYYDPCNPGISYSVAQTTDSAVFCNLPAGNYTLYITDGCGQTNSITHVVPLANGPLTATLQLNNCATSICLSTSGGCPPYSYQWSNGSTIECASGLTPCSPFVVTVTDSKGCRVIKSGLVPGITFNAVNPTCCAANGSICAVVSCFGNGPYIYDWPNGTTTECVTGLAAGTYCVTITNAAGKQITCCYTLTNAPITPPTVTLNYSCSNSLTAVVNNACSDYTFQWDNGNTSSLTRNNLIPCHNYTITITMCDGSVYQRTFKAPQLIPTITPINCLTGIGSICIFPECFDCAPYTYAWSNGATTACLTTSAPGVYGLCVTNSCGDVICCEFTIPLQNLVITGQAWPGCFNAHNGYINITPSGGTAPYTYIWSTNPVKTTANISGLNPGTYTVTVTASNGCTATASYTIGAATTTLILNSSKVTVRCGGALTGSASLLPTGGVPPYSYLWNTGANTSTISLLAAGTYTCTVTDAFGCTKTKTISITQNPPMVVIVSPGINQTATAFVSGGVPPYTYLWNTPTPQTTATATGLLPSHTYKVKVTDSKNCTKLVAITMPAPKIINPELNSTELMVTAVPNPAQDYVTLKFENAVVGETYTVSFTNMLGELIMETIHKATATVGNEKVDVGKLRKGIYNLVIKSDTSQKNVRLIIQ